MISIIKILQVYVVIQPFEIFCSELIQAGSYTRTSVFYEPSTCEQSLFNNYLSSHEVRSVTECGLMCSVTFNCRRYMIDVRTRRCSLYASGEHCFSDGNIGDKRCYRQRSLCTEIKCIRCPIGYYGDTCQHIIQDCSDPNMTNLSISSACINAFFRPTPDGIILEARCVYKPGTLQSTIVQYRGYICSEVNFTRTWDEYANGFGNVHSEYWLGLNHIHNILHNFPHYRLILKVRSSSNTKNGFYKNFYISNDVDNFRVLSALYANNDPRPVTGTVFSTYDRDYSNNNCPDRFKGGWWFQDSSSCNTFNPTGKRNDSVFEANMHWLQQFPPEDKILGVILMLRRET